MTSHVLCDIGERPMTILAYRGEKPNSLLLYDNSLRWSLIDWGERGNFSNSLETYFEQPMQYGPPEGGGSIVFGPPDGWGKHFGPGEGNSPH